MANIGLIDIGARLSLDNVAKSVKQGIGMLQGFASKIGGITTMIGGMGAAIGAGAIAAGLQSVVTSSMDVIDELGDMASQLGTTAGKLQELQYIAQFTGTEVEALAPSIQKMSVNLSHAAAEGGKSAAAFTKLGLDAKKLKELNPSEAFMQIATAISTVPNNADRAALAMQIFGKSGTSLLNTLGAGPERIAELRAEFERLGLSMSDVDAENVGKAKDALDRAGWALSGLGNKLTIAVAPYIEALADKFTELASSGVDLGQIVATSMGWVGAAIGLVVDEVNVFRLAFLTVQSVVTSGIASMVSTIATFGQALQFVLNMLPGVEVSFGDTLTQMAVDLDKLAKEQAAEAWKGWTSPPPSTAINQFFADIGKAAGDSAAKIESTSKKFGDMTQEMEKSKNKAEEYTEKLNLQLATFGMTNDQVEVYKLKKEGATAAEIASIEALQRQIAALEQRKKVEQEIQNDAKAVWEATRTPLEKYNLELAKLGTQRATGNLDEDTYQRGVAAARAKLDQPAIEARKKQEEELNRQAESVIEATRTPMEKFEIKMAELQKLLGAGKINQTQFDRAAEAARKEMAGTGPTAKNESPFANALVLGSQGARDAKLRSMGLSTSGKDSTKDVAKNTKEQIAIQKETNSILRSLASNRTAEEILIF